METSNYILEYIALIIFMESIGWLVAFHDRSDLWSAIPNKSIFKIITRRMVFSIPIVVVTPNNPEGFIAIISVLLFSLMVPTFVAARLVATGEDCIKYINRGFGLVLATGLLLLVFISAYNAIYESLLSSLPLLIITAGIFITQITATPGEMLERYAGMLRVDNT